MEEYNSARSRIQHCSAVLFFAKGGWASLHTSKDIPRRLSLHRPPKLASVCVCSDRKNLFSILIVGFVKMLLYHLKSVDIALVDEPELRQQLSKKVMIGVVNLMAHTWLEPRIYAGPIAGCPPLNSENAFGCRIPTVFRPARAGGVRILTFLVSWMCAPSVGAPYAGLACGGFDFALFSMLRSAIPLHPNHLK
jgi:hypothetical protein